MMCVVSFVLGVKRALVFFLAMGFLGLASTPKRAPIKIACIGTGITYGHSIDNREKNTFPSQLQCMLAGGYEVKNFGVSGATLLRSGDLPYQKESAYREAIAYKPDIAFIELGSNDSKPQNRAGLKAFESDYKALIADIRKANPKVRVILLCPIPSFVKDSTSVWDAVIKNDIIPKVQNVAFDTKSEVIDLYQCLIDKPNLLPDQIHPDGLGATVIARRLYEAIVQQTAKSLDFSKNNTFKAALKSHFFGHELVEFKLNNVDCKLAKPKKPAVGYPWILRARFWGHQPQTDIALLERGFYIAYCDVENLYGNAEAVSRWDTFYKAMLLLGLSKKVVLEGMSRGGLPVYHWALKYPDRVACIYADAPVLDGKSWPGGLGKGAGNEAAWRDFKKAYGLADQNAISQYQSVVSQAKAIAKAGYPMLHVCGTDDEVVPLDENTAPFAKAVLEHGGNIKTIYKTGVGHHPHSLENPTTIVEFILRATHHKLNLAIVPASSGEYRSGAGWKGNWWRQAADIDSLCRNTKNVSLLLIGNSITQGLGGNRPNVTYKPGLAAAETHFKGMTWISAGISGDRTQNILWRLQNGEYQACKAKYVVLAIGVNNFIEDDNAEDIAEGITQIVKIIRAKFPADTNILLFGLLPTGIEPQSERRAKYQSILKNIEPLGALPKVHLCTDVLPLFTDNTGALNTKLYSADGIHLTPEGYSVWARYIASKLKTL